MFASTDKMYSCPPRSLIMEPKWKSSVELAPNCPRCASSNTKFCYYNNYSLSQPRYFCKGCRRYWTKGGSLRNVPVGGGYRKTRRGKPVRMSPAERVPMAYCHLKPSSDSFNPPLENSGSSNGNSVNGASEIDLAVVFAKYLNQNPCEPTISAPELPNAIEETSFDASNSSNPSADSPSSLQILQETNMFEFQNQFESAEPDTQLINGGSADQVFPGENQFQETIINPQFMICHEQNANYGLDSLMMSNELVSSSDVLWPVTPAASNLFTWHPPELQEFEPVLIPEDHLMIYPNLVTDTWGSFE